MIEADQVVKLDSYSIPTLELKSTKSHLAEHEVTLSAFETIRIFIFSS